MGTIIVETGKLREYGSNLESYAKEFHTITEKMDEIVKSLKGSWSGYDASKFINNATKYIENLKVIEEELNTYGSTAQRRSSKYDQRVEEFYNNLKG